MTAYAAGHLVGGSIWAVTTPDGEQILYANRWNHRRERHLNGCVLESAFSRPAVLITDATGALSAPVNTAQRDRDLLDAVLATLRADGLLLYQSYLMYDVLIVWMEV